MHALFALLLQDNYTLGPDSQRQEGVPVGIVTKMEPWKNSKIFEGSERDWWIYVPAQYKPDGKAACLMVFQDGGGYVNEKGGYRVPVVFDNLIHKKEMPVTIGVFVNPSKQRSVEYDTLSDRYVKFLLEEIVPEVEKKFNTTKDPRGSAIGGASSGGICAWTAAWERPDAFRKVLSHVGSFTNIRGGHNYPAWIRKTPPKPIRIFMQDGSADLDNEHGNWPLANQELAASLKFMRYDFRFEFGTGAHNGKHGGSLMPESMRWLWRPELTVKIKSLDAQGATLDVTTLDHIEWNETTREVKVTAGSDQPFKISKIEPNAKVRGYREKHDHSAGGAVKVTYELADYQTDRLIYVDDTGHEREVRSKPPLIARLCDVCK